MIALLVEDNEEGHRLTGDQARQLRDRWVVRRGPQPCQHFQLELMWTEAGESTGTYACIQCGTEVCHVAGVDLR